MLCERMPWGMRAAIEVSLFPEIFSVRRDSLTQNCRNLAILFSYDSRCVIEAIELLIFILLAVNFFSKSILGRGFKLPNRGTSGEKSRTSMIARIGVSN